MKVVTSGLKFLDIDAYASSIAYAELLCLKGYDAIAYSSATINESVTKTIRSWKVDFSSTYVPDGEDSFILVDVSEPEYLEKAVDINKVEEVIDHHVGYEQFWKEKIGDNAQLEFIGAACTQIYEKWVSAGELGNMSQTSARLLVCGILDNTLHFKASVTNERDEIAYKELLKIADLPGDWPMQYFEECQQSILEDIHEALLNDTKLMTFKNLPSGAIAVGQLVVWDGAQIIKWHRFIAEDTMHEKSKSWFLNVVSISEGRSYFLASDVAIETWAETILGSKFNDGFAEADRLWLRKEIFREDQLS